MEFNFRVNGGSILKKAEATYSRAYYPFLIPGIFEGTVIKKDRLGIVLNHIFDEYHTSSSQEELYSLIKQMKRSCLCSRDWLNGCMGNEGLDDFDFSDSKEKRLKIGFANAEFLVRRLGCSLAFRPVSFSSSLTESSRIMRIIEKVMDSKTSPIMPLYDRISVLHAPVCNNGEIDLIFEIKNMSLYSAGAIFSWSRSIAQDLVGQFVNEIYEKDFIVGTFLDFPIFARLKYIGNDNEMSKPEKRSSAVSAIGRSELFVEESIRSQLMIEYFVKVGLDINPVFIDKVAQEILDKSIFYNEQIMMSLTIEILVNAIDRVNLDRFLRKNPEITGLIR